MKHKLVIKIFLTDSEKCKVDDLIRLNNGVVFQEPLLNQIVSSVFRTELKHYLIFENNHLDGYCAVHTRKNRFLSVIEYKPPFDIPYGGFIIDFSKCSLENIFSLLPHPLLSKYIYSTPPIINGGKTHGGFEQFNRMETSLVDLSLSENYIWNCVLNPKRRNMIRRAQNSGIIIKKFANAEGLKLFWPVLNDLHFKLGYHQLSYGYYNEVLEPYLMMNKAAILLAFRNDEIISGIILIGNSNFMHYWKGAGKSAGNNAGCCELLQWEAIKYSKAIGSKYYDTCVIEKERLPQIAKFKLGISDNIAPFYTISCRSLLFKVVNRIQNIVYNSN